MSRLLYAAGGWPLLTKTQESSVTSACMHVYRRATGTTYVDRMNAGLDRVSDAEVIQEHSLPLPLTLVRLLRLNLFMRVTVGKNATLKAIVFASRLAKKSWLAAVESDYS